MDVGNLIEVLKELAPELTEKGFINISSTGDGVPVKRLGVCVDPTESTIAGAVNKGVNILISYHPWNGEAKWMVDSSNLGIIPLHTAWDNAPEGANIIFAREIGLTEITPYGNVVIGKTDTILRNLLERCQRAVDQNIIPYYGEPKTPVMKVGIWTGPGFLPFNKKIWETCHEQGCDTIISGEASLLPIRFAARHQVQLIDMGHSLMARPGMLYLAKLLKTRLREDGCTLDFFADCYGCNYYTNFYYTQTDYTQTDDSEEFISLFTHARKG